MLSTWMGDHQGRPGVVNLGPFVGVDLNIDRPSIYPSSCWHGRKMNQIKPNLVIGEEASLASVRSGNAGARGRGSDVASTRWIRQREAASVGSQADDQFVPRSTQQSPVLGSPTLASHNTFNNALL